MGLRSDQTVIPDNERRDGSDAKFTGTLPVGIDGGMASGFSAQAAFSP